MRSASAQRAVREEEEREVRAPQPRQAHADQARAARVRSLARGLLVDKRVKMFDKLLVAGAVVYIVSPIDLIPDFIPFFGEIESPFLLVLALQHLINNAGRCLTTGRRSRGPRGSQPEERVGGGGVLPSQANSPAATRNRTALGGSRVPRGLPSIRSRAYFSPWQPEHDPARPATSDTSGSGLSRLQHQGAGPRACAMSTRHASTMSRSSRAVPTHPQRRFGDFASRAASSCASRRLRGAWSTFTQRAASSRWRVPAASACCTRTCRSTDRPPRSICEAVGERHDPQADHTPSVRYGA